MLQLKKEKSLLLARIFHTDRDEGAVKVGSGKVGEFFDLRAVCVHIAQVTM